VLSKSLGSQNPINLVKATEAALESLRKPEEVAELRGISVAEVLGLGDGSEAADESGQSPDESRQTPDASRQEEEGAVAEEAST